MAASNFNSDYYLTGNPDVADAVRSGLFVSAQEHYLQFGQYEGRAPNPYFQPAYYLVNNPDVAAAIQAGVFASAWDHFINHGSAEGRAPGRTLAQFDADSYLSANPDVEAAVAAGVFPNALAHYLLFGLTEGREAHLEGFDAETYLAANADVAEAVAAGAMSAVEHWLLYGHVEGRQGAFAEEPVAPTPATGGGGAPVNQPPTSIALDGRAIEAGILGAEIGSLRVADPDHASGHTLAIAGDDRFELVGNILKLKDEAALAVDDPLAQITITATDPGGASVSESFTVGAGFLTAGGGADVLRAPDSGATLRGGAGVDAMYGGAGDDTFVIVGSLLAGGKTEDPLSTTALGFPISQLNGVDLDEDANGGPEVLDGGGGNNTLLVIGDADLTGYHVSNIDILETRSNVTLASSQLSVITTINGDGRSVLRIVNLNPSAGPVVVDLTQIDLGGLGILEVGDGVTLAIGSIDDLGGCRILTGTGTISSTNGPLTLSSDIAVEGTLRLTDADGSPASTDAEVISRVVKAASPGTFSDTPGNDYLVGTDYDDVFLLENGGNDVVNSRGGNDRFIISGPGQKTLLSALAGTETIDLSQSPVGADLDLSRGGNLGVDLTTIRVTTGGVDSALFQEAVGTNVMLILDVSGSMSGYNIGAMKQAANDLLDAYRDAGEAAVRIVTFQSSATSSFGGVDAWMDIDAARGVIAGLNAGGGTEYVSALNVAMSAWAVGQGDDFITGGRNGVYFLSDGQPNRELYASEQDSWETFLIENGITANAIGFGGLSNSRPLEPIAFDGAPLQSVSDSRDAAQIDPVMIEDFDAETLAQSLISRAGLDYVDNLIGTPFDDILVGNSLDNVIYGLGGNNTIRGGSGIDVLVGDDVGFDVAVFDYTRSDYSFSTVPISSFPVVPATTAGECAYGLRVEGTGLGRDGVTYLTSSIDSLLFEGDGVTVPITDLFDTLEIPDTWLEVFAREVAYGLDLGGVGPSLDPFLEDYPWLCTYRIDAVFTNAGDGDYARPWLGLEAVGLVSDIAPPVLAFRGTAQIPEDALADLHPTAVGWDQLQDSRPEIVDWLGSVDQPYITGHSLGGALAQQAAVAFLQDTPDQLGGVVTFNAAGIDAVQADAFDLGRVTGRVHHHIAAGDVVSLAGDAFIAGEWTQYIYDSPSLFWDFLLDKHTRDLLQGSDVPSDVTKLSYSSTADLNSATFNHYAAIPVDYFLFILQVSGALGSVGALLASPKVGWKVGSWAAESLSTRGAAESARSDIGLAVSGAAPGVDFVLDAIDFIRDATGLGIEYMIGGVESAWEILVNAATAFEDAIDRISQHVGEWMSAGAAAALEFASAVADWGAETWGALVEVGLGAWDQVQAFWDATTDLVADGFDSLTSFLGHLGDLTYEALQSLKGAAVEAWETLMGWGAELWADAVSWGAETWETLATWSAETWEAAADWAEGAWRSLGEMTGEALASVRDLGADVAQGLADLGDAAWDNAVSFLEATADLVDDVSDAGKAVLDWFRKILPGGNPWTIEEATHLAEHGWLGFDYEMKDNAEALFLAAQAGADYLDDAGLIIHLGLGGEIGGVAQTRAHGTDGVTDSIQVAGLVAADSLVFGFEPGPRGDRLDLWAESSLGQARTMQTFDNGRGVVLGEDGTALVSLAAEASGVSARIEQGPNEGAEIGLVGVSLDDLAAANFALA